MLYVRVSDWHQVLTDGPRRAREGKEGTMIDGDKVDEIGEQSIGSEDRYCAMQCTFSIPIQIVCPLSSHSQAPHKVHTKAYTTAPTDHSRAPHRVHTKACTTAPTMRGNLHLMWRNEKACAMAWRTAFQVLSEGEVRRLA